MAIGINKKYLEKTLVEDLSADLVNGGGKVLGAADRTWTHVAGRSRV